MRRSPQQATTRWVFPQAGTYGNKTDYFLTNADQAHWGPHLERLQAIKRRVDPTNLFRVHIASATSKPESANASILETAPPGCRDAHP